MQTPSITGVAEIVLNVSDLPRMREFYSELLGFLVHSEVSLERAEPDPNGVPTITFLTICETDTPLGRGGHPQMLALIDFRRHVYARDRFVECDPTRSTMNHLAFEIPPNRFDDHADQLRRQGIDLWLSEFPAMNAKAMFFHDPENNLLELICHLPNTD